MSIEMRGINNIAAGKELQRFINQQKRSPLLVEDGVIGPISIAGVYQTFVNKQAVGITGAQIDEVAKSLGEKNSTRIRAIAEVESNGSGWSNNGMLKILYERHYFHRLTKGRAGNTWFSNAKAGDYTLDADNDGINDSWEKLAAACRVDALAAFQSVSLTQFQIMGAHYEKLGYSRPWEMMLAATDSELVHYQLMAKWINLDSNGRSGLKAMSNDPNSCRAFARFWNGPAYATNNYHAKLAAAVNKHSRVYGAP